MRTDPAAIAWNLAQTWAVVVLLLHPGSGGAAEGRTNPANVREVSYHGLRPTDSAVMA